MKTSTVLSQFIICHDMEFYYVFFSLFLAITNILSAQGFFTGYYHGNSYMPNAIPKLPFRETSVTSMEAPFMALIFADNSFREYPFMTGVIISNRWILTTAKTLEIQKGKRLKALTGIHNLTNKIDERLFNRVVYGTIHSNYRVDEVYNDIALVRLEREIMFNERQNLIHLMSPEDLTYFNYQSPFYNSRVNLTVYHYGSPDLTSFKILKKNVISVNTGVVDFSDRLFVCAQRTIATCYGDTGSPAVVDGKLVGLVAVEYGCGFDFPNVFIGVAHYYEWIRNTVTA